LNPSYAISFLAHADGWIAFTVLGSVFLALTGGEALYADMGHFGRKAIRLDWFVFVMPALVLNYFGQGALVLSNPDTSINPFFLMFPTALLVPIVVLTTAATVIASQAVISGAFALVQQAIQLGALPRLDVKQTSDEAVGQVYVPQVNWLLAIAVLALVFGFRSSDALANAYGIAVAGDMLVTTVLVTTAAVVVWQWPLVLIGPVAAFFFMLDATFVVSNAHKIPQGGWFPLLVGSVALTLMLSWRRGREVALARREADAIPLQTFIDELSGPHPPLRVPGTAIYFTTRQDIVPAALSLSETQRRRASKFDVLENYDRACSQSNRFRSDFRQRTRAWAGASRDEIRLRSKARCTRSPRRTLSRTRAECGPSILLPGQGGPSTIASSGCAALAGKALRIHDA
jgi:KUP system potassium uptake protein